VQTREQTPIPFPADRDGLIFYQPLKGLQDLHPCPKTIEEMAFVIESLTKPGQIVLDCFCGLGSTLVAAQQLGRFWVGCDRSRHYCQIAIKRLKGSVARGNNSGD
jgi:site-specific DNA-methyltransferase (adenine-specific)